MKDNSAELTAQEKQYNDDSFLLDGLYEFHPDFFTDLKDPDRKALERYYLVGQEVPKDIFEYRRELLSEDPQAQERAEVALKRLLAIAGITST